MLFFFLYLCKTLLWIDLILFICTLYAYAVNERRGADDPRKKDIEPVAVFIAPFTWPFLLFVFVLLFVLRIVNFFLKAILYGVFLVLFTVILTGIRKPILFVMLDKAMNSIGETLLEANTLLLRFFLSPWSNRPKTI